MAKYHETQVDEPTEVNQPGEHGVPLRARQTSSRVPVELFRKFPNNPTLAKEGQGYHDQGDGQGCVDCGRNILHAAHQHNESHPAPECEYPHDQSHSGSALYICEQDLPLVCIQACKLLHHAGLAERVGKPERRKEDMQQGDDLQRTFHSFSSVLLAEASHLASQIVSSMTAATS